MFLSHSHFRNHSLDFWRRDISFHETSLSADDREANVYAKSGPSRPGVLWPGQGLRHGHTTFRGGTVHPEGGGGERWLENASHFLPSFLLLLA